MKRFIIYMAATMMLSLVSSAANGFLPLITNFNDDDYGAQFQNWSADIDRDGTVYFGNSEGLLVFDGYNWDTYRMPQGTIVRSVLCDDDRIYAGTFEDFGYFTRDEIGDLKYTSLTTHRDGVKMENEEIWKMLRFGHYIYFQSFNNIWIYEPETDTVSMLPTNIAERPDSEGDGTMRPLFCYIVNGHIYAQRVNGSLYRYERGGWRRYWPKNLFGSHIMGMIPPAGTKQAMGEIPDGTLVFTEDHLVYKVSDGCPKPLRTQIDEAMKFSRINRVAELDDGTIYVGTVGSGIFHIDRDGNLLEHYTTSNGLQNNTVLGLSCDSQGNVWAALDDGISLIHSGLPYKILRPGPSGFYLGRSYGIGMFGNFLLIATNQAAYSFDITSGGFSTLADTKGQNWFVRNFDGQTFIGNNDRSLIIDSSGKVSSLATSGTDIKKAYINGEEILLQSTYYPLLIYQRDADGSWSQSHVVSGFGPIRQIETDADGSVWCAHMSTGLIKTKLSNDLKRISTKKSFSNLDGDSIPKHCYIMKILGKLYFTHGEGFYTFDDENNTFRRADKISDDLHSLTAIVSAESVDDNHFWISSLDSYNFVEYDGNDYNLKYSIPMSVFPRKNNGDNSCTFTNGNITYFTTNDGIGLVDISNLGERQDSIRLGIHSIGSFDAHGQFIKLPYPSNGRFELPEANMKLSLRYPNHIKSQYRYRFKLDDGRNGLDSITPKPEITYSMLTPGKHKLHCGVFDIAGNEITHLDYEFSAPRPWPLRWWAILMYLVIIGAAIYAITQVHTRRSIRRRQMEFDRAKAEQDAQLREQALIIAEQKQQLLESELSTKGKELASMALGAYARQHTIDNMRASIADLRKKGAPVSEAEKVLRTMSAAGEDSSKFWDVFEKNFDLIHEHFFRDLRKAYPSLTPADMKFCALLRMNMSTKEISRFTNLSIRGVETARYRLRKKFALGADDSLVQFLIDFRHDDTQHSQE